MKNDMDIQSLARMIHNFADRIAENEDTYDVVHLTILVEDWLTIEYDDKDVEELRKQYCEHYCKDFE